MHYLWLFIVSPGFAGTMAVAAALVAFWSTQRSVHISQRASRMEWALNQLLRDDDAARSAGLAMLEELAKRVKAQSEEEAIIRAALGAVMLVIMRRLLKKILSILHPLRQNGSRRIRKGCNT